MNEPLTPEQARVKAIAELMAGGKSQREVA